MAVVGRVGVAFVSGFMEVEEWAWFGERALYNAFAFRFFDAILLMLRMTLG